MSTQQERDEIYALCDSGALDVPEVYICPITKKIMRDPVNTLTGRTYDREQIALFIAKNGIDGYGEPCSQQLTPDLHMRGHILNWVDERVSERKKAKEIAESAKQLKQLERPELKNTYYPPMPNKYACPAQVISDVVVNSIYYDRLGDCLKIAAANGNIREIDELLEEPYNVEINTQGSKDSICAITRQIAKITPLIAAAKWNQPEAVRHLLSRGAVTCAVDGSGYTALDTAFYYYHTEVAEILLNKGAKAKKKDQHIWLVHAAVGKGDTKMLGLLNKAGVDLNAEYKKSTPLILAVHLRHYAAFRFLVAESKQAINLNVVYTSLMGMGKQSTALDFAIEWMEAGILGGMEAADFLLKEGVKVIDPNRYLSYLQQAVIAEKTEKAQFYIEKLGIDVNYLFSDGKKVLDHAVQAGHRERCPGKIIDYLLKRGATVADPARYVDDLKYAVKENCKTDTIDFFVNAIGVDINAIGSRNLLTWWNDLNGKTPLMIAAKSRFFPLAKHISKMKNIHLNLINPYSHKSALDYARENNDQKMDEYLTSHGATLNKYKK